MKDEVFVFRGEVWIPCILPTEQGVLPLSATSCDPIPVELTVRHEERHTVLVVRFSWRRLFDPHITNLQSQPIADGKLLVPENGSIGEIGANVMLVMVRPSVLRLAVASNYASFLTAFDEADTSELLRDVEVTVAGSTYKLAPSPRYLTGAQPRPTVLDTDAIREAVARGVLLEDLYLAISDRSYARNDLYTMLATLTTALEVAANSYLKCAPFSAFRHLGQTAFARTSFDEYIACYELCEARHELVHNGNLMVRTFDRTTNRVDRSNLRPFTGTARVAFRSGAAAAITWMRANPTP